MALTLVSTSGGATSNSYVASTTEADSLAAELGSMLFYGVSTAGYLAASTDIKTRALILAAQRIDTLPFLGMKQTDSQAREFPRLYMPTSQMAGVIPDEAKLAQVAEACSLFTSPTTTQQAMASGLQSFSIGEQSASFGGSGMNTTTQTVSGQAREILRGAGYIAGDIASVPSIRG